jgi:tetratricopeptide (TPR) repeat protein
MKRVVFWGLLLAAGPARAASPDSASVAVSALDSSPTAAQAMEIDEERMKQGNYAGAAFQFQRAVEKEPSNLAACLKLGSAYTKAGLKYAVYFSKAESTYARVAALAGKDNVEYRKGMAELDLAQWNVDHAITLCEGLTTEHPDSCDYWLRLANAQRMKGLQVEETEGRESAIADLDLAERTSRKAMGLCPDRIEPVQMLAAIMNTRKSYSEVVDLYHGLLEQRPDNLEFFRGYATACFNARDWEKAAQTLGELLKKDPRYEERLMYISALRKLNRLPEAEEQLRIARLEAPKPEGPVQLTSQDVLKEKIGLQEDVEQGIDLVEKGQCDAAVSIWKGTRTRIEAYLQDPEFKDAAEDLLVWLDRRILYAQGKCK